MTRRELIMKTALIAIVIVASTSPAAYGALTISAPSILVSDVDLTGSFEVFLSTDEVPLLSGYQTQLDLNPTSGITFTGVEMTSVLTPIFPGSTPFATIDNGGATILVGDSLGGAYPNLFDNAGLFKVNFSINPGSPPYPIFDVGISDTFLWDDTPSELVHDTSDGEIQIEQSGPHQLRVEFREKTGGSAGNWDDDTTSLLLTYGETGATLDRVDSGLNGDIPVGWGNAKFADTEEGDYGVYSRGTPFGSGDDMLAQDARPLTDTTSNVLIETYTNKIFEKPVEWIVGQTWNEGGSLEFTVESTDKTYFDGFTLVQKEPGRFLDHPGVVPVLLGDILDANGHGVLDFDRFGVDWLPGTEIDWWTGPFASFDLIPTDGVAWVGPEAPLSIESGTFSIGHPPTPEPSTFALLALALAGLGAFPGRKRLR
jgi:hypothetical protein